MAAGVIYLNQLTDLSKQKQYWLIAAGGTVFSLIALLTTALLARQVLAIGAATVIPVLSLNYVLNNLDNYHGGAKRLIVCWQCATWQLALAVALSLIGRLLCRGYSR
jgi:hypothetical protein